MSQRKVFGRLRFWDGKDDYRIEMRADALWIRKRHSRKEWSVPFIWLLRFCHQQLEIFNEGMDKGDSGKPVPGVQEGQLVPDRGQSSAMHEAVQRSAKDAQERRDGLAALIGRAEASDAGDRKEASSSCGLQGSSVSLAPTHDAGDVSEPGEEPGS